MEPESAAATLPLNIKYSVAHFGDQFQKSGQLAHIHPIQRQQLREFFRKIFVLSGFKLPYESNKKTKL